MLPWCNMDLYKVNKLIKLTSGLVGITSKQADRRKTCLKAVADGVYEIVDKVYFKAGEEIKLDSVSRSIAVNLTNVETKKKLTEQIAEEKATKKRQTRRKKK